MRCQTVCPENRQFLSWVEDRVEFFEEETELLLEITAMERLPAETKRKLERLDLLEDADILSHNLKVFFRKWK
jgi:epoxyqueuosine reductase